MFKNLKIYTNGAIEVNGFNTGYNVRQTKEGTVVYKCAKLGETVVNTLQLPHLTYSLATTKTTYNGIPGRAQFEKEFLEAYSPYSGL